MIPIFRPQETLARNRNAFTLFEVVLAIGLAVVLVGLLATAVHLYLVAIDAGRNEVEQTQLARAILQRMSDDIRAAFQFSEQDVSSVATLAEETGSFDLESLDEEDPDTTTDSEDDTAIADNLVPPPVPGVYGNLNELQVDISRIPRFDEIDAMIALAGQAGTEHLSDIRTVSYFMSTNAPIGASTAAAVGISANNMSYGGLYRREMDRATAEFSATSAGGLSTDTAVLLAPEVTWVDFRYFNDGTETRCFCEKHLPTPGNAPPAPEDATREDTPSANP